MRRPDFIQLGNGARIPILYEDRAVMAIDKPRGWMLAPYNWQKTAFNLQPAIDSAIHERLLWARSRSLKFLRHVHRLDAETSGVLLLVKSLRAVQQYALLFERRAMEKVYLAVVEGVPKALEWSSRSKLAPDPKQIGKMQIDSRGKTSETQFRVLAKRGDRALIEARPYSGRTHQIRVHAAEAGHALAGDELYGRAKRGSALGLRAVFLGYRDPFTRKQVAITAPHAEFVREFGFPAGVLGSRAGQGIREAADLNSQTPTNPNVE